MGSRKGCYDGYGCFSTDYPFSNTEGFLPQSPDYLNVRIQLYTRQNRNNAIDVTEGVGKTFDSSKDIKIIIHGYMNRMNVQWLTEMHVYVFCLYLCDGEDLLIYKTGSKDEQLINRNQHLAVHHLLMLDYMIY
jgi:uncharacterized protein (UPF0264 family)